MQHSHGIGYDNQLQDESKSRAIDGSDLRAWEQAVQESMNTDLKAFKQQLPLARIKKIMKSDQDVRMISAEAPVLFSKACELFILDLTLRAWSYAELNDRKTLCRNDIADAIQSSDMFDFLQGVVTREDDPNMTGGSGHQGMDKR